MKNTLELIKKMNEKEKYTTLFQLLYEKLKEKEKKYSEIHKIYTKLTKPIDH